MKTIFVLLSLLVSSLSYAEEFPSGGSADSEFAKGFGKESGLGEKDNREVDLDRLKIGGSLRAEWIDYILEDQTQDDLLTNPLTLELYADAQLKNEVRAFFRGRLIHDETINEAVPSPLTAQKQQQTQSSLDELKLSFNSSHRVFWTLGRQKIKWGASQFWNPTDFVNQQRRDLLQAEDLRAGVGLIKAHVPIGRANFYLLGIESGANQSNDVGEAARIEIPFSFGEWTASQYTRKGESARVGTDFSIAVWDFDIYAEGAQTDKGKDSSLSGGVNYAFKYTDDDSLTLGVEAFWQENGTDDKSSYLTLLTQNKFVPFYVGKSYAMASISLPKPGSWNQSSFSVYGIRNNSDSSSYLRSLWVYTGITDLQLMINLGGRYGEKDAEMRFFHQLADIWLQLKVVF